MLKYEEELKLLKDNYVVNWHEHVYVNAQGGLDERNCDILVSGALKTGIDKLLCSVPIFDNYCTPEQFRQANNATYEAMKKYPDVIMGMAFVNSGYTQETIEEIERCVNGLGMVGVKMYYQYFIDEPVQFKVIEKCIDLDIPILMHAGKASYYEPWAQPRMSNGMHFANVAKRYPEANLIMAHIGGGGDWHWQVKAIRDTPNVVTDISGSVFDSGMIEYAVSNLGVDRILFGTDGSFSSSIGKLLGAEISMEDKITILQGSKYRRFVERKCK